MGAKPLVDTKRVKIREVRLGTLEQWLAEVERIAAADRDGRVRLLGNWTVGQVFGHMAYWLDASFDGYEQRPPLVVRLLGPLMKKGMISKRPKPGFRLPGAPEGTYGTAVMTTEEGLARVRRAIGRLQASTPESPSPVFGRMSRDEWLGLHLRHAELHLGFLVVEGDAV